MVKLVILILKKKKKKKKESSLRSDIIKWNKDSVNLTSIEFLTILKILTDVDERGTVMWVQYMRDLNCKYK